MKICVSEGEIKCCDPTEDGCNECVTKALKLVERMTNSELMDVAGQSAEYAKELSSINDGLYGIYSSSRLSKANKRELIFRIARLRKVAEQISSSGSTLRFNLMLNKRQETALEDSVHNSTANGLPF